MAPVGKEIPPRATEEELPAEQNGAHPVDSMSEMFSRHESCLTSHLELTKCAMGRVVPDSDAFRAISLMLDRTQELMHEVESIKMKLSATGVASRVFPSPDADGQRSGRNMESVTSRRDTNENTDEPSPTTQTAVPESADQEKQPTPAVNSNLRTPSESHHFNQRSFRKRSRGEEDTVMPEAEHEVTNVLGKRKRTKDTLPGGDEDVESVIPISVPTEDISEEVERRLKLREERRRKRNSRPEKRRWDGVDSSDFIQLYETTRKIKKQKLKGESSETNSDQQPG